ncbi:hypothetical protein RDI58_000008 [Solanum bulbocastanum]|uniref:Uncharacterized protein n=2 Tax=Solanum TaxID=4107 RepID=A0A494G922_SOLLC
MNKRKKRNRGAQQIPFSILSPFADSAYFPYTRKAPPKSDFQLGVFTPGTASPPNFNRGQKLGRTLLHGKACQRLTGLGIGVANCSTLDQRIPAIKEGEREQYTPLLHLNPLFIQQKPGAD